MISSKTVLLRADLDVPLGHFKDNGRDRMVVLDDFRLRTLLPTLYLCLQYAEKVIIMGHIGRPKGVEKELSVAPIVDWLDREVPEYDFPRDKLQVLENLRFEEGEDACDEKYAKELAAMGNFYINEAFAAHHPASSTTLLPALLPHACGFHFEHEVRVLKGIRENTYERPVIAIIGGAKIEDKLPVVSALAKVADHVLVGGKLPQEIEGQGISLPGNVYVAKMGEGGKDISEESVREFREILKKAKQVVWSGPMGQYEKGFNKGNKALAEEIISSGAESIIGGGDTINALALLGLINYFSFVSVGGGAMLEYLVKGTLPAIEALNGHP